MMYIRDLAAIAGLTLVVAGSLPLAARLKGKTLPGTRCQTGHEPTPGLSKIASATAYHCRTDTDQLPGQAAQQRSTSGVTGGRRETAVMAALALVATSARSQARGRRHSIRRR